MGQIQLKAWITLSRQIGLDFGQLSELIKPCFDHRANLSVEFETTVKNKIQIPGKRLKVKTLKCQKCERVTELFGATKSNILSLLLI